MNYLISLNHQLDHFISYSEYGYLVTLLMFLFTIVNYLTDYLASYYFNK
jgi:uncharacterized protein YqgC (DUF456 family)